MLIKSINWEGRILRETGILRKSRLESLYVQKLAKKTFRVQENGAEGRAKTETHRPLLRLLWLQVFLLQLAKYHEKKNACK